jgi:oxygen-independent coproporphyrinogen III oxidase
MKNNQEMSENYSKLASIAKKNLDDFGLNELRINGYFRESRTYSYVFQYPPTVALNPFTVDDLLPRSIPDSKSRNINLYIHIPYCSGTCSYCYFCRYDIKKSPIHLYEYMDLVQKELHIIRENYIPQSSLISTIAFGGGTPTMMDEYNISSIFSTIKSLFDIRNNIEITFESSPETILDNNEKKFQCMLNNGVNRISIGIQSFDNDRLYELGRRHDAITAINSIKFLKAIGITNINIDLIYGLPKQSLIEWENTLYQAVDTNVESISLYRMRHKSNNLFATSVDTFDDYNILIMYMMAVILFSTNHYIQVSPHIFVKDPKFIQQHVSEKQGINNSELVGIGVSAYSVINSYYYWNIFSINSYKEQILKSRLPIALGTFLSKEELKRKFMVLGLQEYTGVNREKYNEIFSSFPEIDFSEEINKLMKLQLISLDENIKFTNRGYLYADEICTDFYSNEVKEKIINSGIHRYGMNYVGKDYYKYSS